MRAHVHEAGDGHHFAGVLVDKQIRTQRAVRMAGKVHRLLAAQGRDQHRERRHAGQREPVVIRVRVSALFGHLMRHVGLGKPLGRQLVAVQPSGEGDRLEGDGAGYVGVFDRGAHDVADFVVVDAAYDGGHQDDLHARLAAVLDHLHLHVEQRLAAGAQIDLIVCSRRTADTGCSARRLWLCRANSRSASRMPLVAAWMWVKPISLARARASRKRG